MLVFFRICEIGLLVLLEKLCGVVFLVCLWIVEIVMVIGVMMMEFFDVGGSGGNWVIGGVGLVVCGDNRFIVFRLRKNDVVSIVMLIRIVFRF